MTNDHSTTMNLIRSFFESRGLTQIDTNSKLSILAACEDPTTIVPFHYAGQDWPLPQTGQMHLEHALLNNPGSLGYFCMSISYRDEPDPVEDRHAPGPFWMAEFEIPGDIEVLEQFECDLMTHLGFGTDFPSADYKRVAKFYETDELTHEHETRMQDDYGNVFLLKNFPNSTSPFWNMKNDGTTASKIDVIVCGMETIGSAERSCDTDEMRYMFDTISDGAYRDILYTQFTRERVEKELNKFLAHDFFPRCGGGIGIIRMMKALEGKR